MLEWQRVEAVKQRERDHMVCVRIAGHWYLASACEFGTAHTMGRAVQVGDYVRVRSPWTW